MEDDPGAADDERTIELSSIAAIFPEIVLDPLSLYRASLKIPVSPAAPLKVRFQQLAESSVPNLPTPPTSTEPEADDQNTPFEEASQQQYGGLPDVHSLVHLPPLNLDIHLPEGYPAKRPPIFELSSSPAWIPEDTLQRLTKDGVRLWEELGKDQVIFTYIDHLQQAAEAGFDLARDLGRDIALSGDLKIALLDYGLKAKREAFDKETFECGICLEPQKGTVCHRLQFCSHVFCVACLQECYNKCISEGDVDNVKCLHPGCGKHFEIPPAHEQADPELIRAKRRSRHDPTLNPSELLQIPLSEEAVQRYVHLKRKKKLESDKNTVYCPRQWCQGAARSKKHPKPIDPMHDIEDVKSESETEVPDALQAKSKRSKTLEIPMSERLCICEDCSYAFCSVCRKGWHGELTSYSLCNPRSQKELSEEEKATAEYLAIHSTPCPTCAAPCQKTMGCNHMICFKCRTHFCYLCSSYLMESNPYQHFSDKHNPCYMRLWELESGDDENVQVVAWEVPPDDEPLDFDSDTDSSEGERAVIRGDALLDDAAHFSDDEDEAGQQPLHRGRAEPAAPANLQIEIVNFAREGVVNHRIQQIIAAPFPPRQAPAAPVPGPPRRGGGAWHPPRGRIGGRGRGAHIPNQNQNPNPNQGRGRNRGRGNLRAPQAAHRRPPPQEPVPNPIPAESSDSSDTEDEVPLRFPRAAPAPAPGQGNHGQQQPAMLRQVGIDRFLQLAERDQEDEWDSDELEDEMEDLADGRRRGRRMWA
jgi:E3 ubiquitin-protein ligase RNF14